MLLYDFPRDPIEYMRRVGRTARAGRKGVVTVLAWGRQVRNLIHLRFIFDDLNWLPGCRIVSFRGAIVSLTRFVDRGRKALTKPGREKAFGRERISSRILSEMYRSTRVPPWSSRNLL